MIGKRPISLLALIKLAGWLESLLPLVNMEKIARRDANEIKKVANESSPKCDDSVAGQLDYATELATKWLVG